MFSLVMKIRIGETLFKVMFKPRVVLYSIHTFLTEKTSYYLLFIFRWLRDKSIDFKKIVTSIGKYIFALLSFLYFLSKLDCRI